MSEVLSHGRPTGVSSSEDEKKSEPPPQEKKKIVLREKAAKPRVEVMKQETQTESDDSGDEEQLILPHGSRMDPPEN